LFALLRPAWPFPAERRTFYGL